MLEQLLVRNLAKSPKSGYEDLNTEDGDTGYPRSPWRGST
jgi:hypothetical protein